MTIRMIEKRYDNEPEVTAETISMKGIHCNAA